jgi:hypothetical protein
LGRKIPRTSPRRVHLVATQRKIKDLREGQGQGLACITRKVRERNRRNERFPRTPLPIPASKSFRAHGAHHASRRGPRLIQFGRRPVRLRKRPSRSRVRQRSRVPLRALDVGFDEPNLAFPVTRSRSPRTSS